MPMQTTKLKSDMECQCCLPRVSFVFRKRMKIQMNTKKREQIQDIVEQLLNKYSAHFNEFEINNLNVDNILCLYKLIIFGNGQFIFI